MMPYVLIILIGYLFGCLQFAYLYGKYFRQVDIRTLGHKNAGASNAAQSLGMKVGVGVAILDILKAVVSAYLVRLLFPQLIESQGTLPIYLSGAAVIVGHNYPFFMKFKGGKGTASTVGILFSIDVLLGILGVLVVLVITVLTDYIVLGTMGLLVLFIAATALNEFGLPSLVIAILLSLQSFLLHIPNFKRILHKEESGLRATIKKKLP